MHTDEILDILEAMFPDAHCELIHKNPFELLVAVVLSAQTTDEAVNKVTPGSVSYTHLDVYKRQAIYFIFACMNVHRAAIYIVIINAA